MIDGVEPGANKSVRRVGRVPSFFVHSVRLRLVRRVKLISPTASAVRSTCSIDSLYLRKSHDGPSVCRAQEHLWLSQPCELCYVFALYLVFRIAYGEW